ncbi:DNA-binding protein, partial [Mesorhizobium sp. M4A.F.Ca.ET.022.05.2.1]
MSVSFAIYGLELMVQVRGINLDQVNQYVQAIGCMTNNMTEWLTREEALERLKVRPQTLYAYVSRGRIGMRPDAADTATADIGIE